MHRVFLGLGGNIGDLDSNFKKVKDLIKSNCGKIINTSSIFKTPPIGFESVDFFWNQVVEIETHFKPATLLQKTLQIEKEMGRTRVSGQYSSRPMDIDLLYYDNSIIKTDNLQIPHPRIQERKFVLVPLVEIAPDYIHPENKSTNLQLLEQCSDISVIEKLQL
jgi:2-amino-4-hydroxy-6-hydroxymethyldihydropteridine diphosphokinase